MENPQDLPADLLPGRLDQLCQHRGAKVRKPRWVATTPFGRPVEPDV